MELYRQCIINNRNIDNWYGGIDEDAYVYILAQFCLAN